MVREPWGKPHVMWGRPGPGYGVVVVGGRGWALRWVQCGDGGWCRRAQDVGTNGRGEEEGGEEGGRVAMQPLIPPLASHDPWSISPCPYTSIGAHCPLSLICISQCSYQSSCICCPPARSVSSAALYSTYTPLLAAHAVVNDHAIADGTCRLALVIGWSVML